SHQCVLTQRRTDRDRLDRQPLTSSDADQHQYHTANPIFQYGKHRRNHLHSFPTRRSSDLNAFTGTELYRWSIGLYANFASYTGRDRKHTSELQSLAYLVCRLLLEKKNMSIWRC